MTSGYSVRLAEDQASVLDDVKGLPAHVRRELFAVMRSELRQRPVDGDPDDGWVREGKWLFRRGITRAQRRDLAGLPATATPPGPQAWDFVIIYRSFNTQEYRECGSDGFYVWRVWSNEQLAAMLLRNEAALKAISPVQLPSGDSVEWPPDGAPQSGIRSWRRRWRRRK